MQRTHGRVGRVRREHGRVALALVLTLAWAILGLVGCKRDVPEPPVATGASDENTATSFQALTFDGGPSCSGSGSPTTGVDAGVGGGSTCTGALAQSSFVNGVCTCEGLNVSGAFTVDGFDSTEGAPDGGAGGSVGVNGTQTWSNTVSITGNVVTKGAISASGAGRIRGDLRLGGTLSASAPLTVDGNAYTVQSLPASVQVAGTKTHVSSVAAPCDCTNVVPVAAIVAAHRGTANDNASIGLSSTAATGAGPSQIHLPCGNYYLTQINKSAPLTITAHGHTALYIDGNVTASGGLTFAVDTAAGATLDLFIAGSLSSSNTLVLGSTAKPATCRAYVAGSSLAMSATSTLGCNVYAPNAALAVSGTTTAYGALFVKRFNSSGAATIHYDTSIQRAGSECCSQATCDDHNPCTIDSCNGNGTCSHLPATNGTSCNDGNSCTQTDTCQSGACTGSNPVTCTASDQCHAAGTCDPTTGACSNPAVANGVACNDGNACTQSDTCQAGTCAGANPVTCTASDQCHAAGTCDPASGTCSNPAAANGTACNDGSACTQSDTCQSGTCTGANPVTCVASDQCHAAGLCDPASGQCTSPALPNGVACNDGNACTQSDSCQAGACVGASPVTCTASDQCHAAGTCDPASGACTNPAAANGTACSDGNACTQSDTCQTGVCTGASPVTCTASDQCHGAGTCNPSTGACSNPAVANGTTCSDGSACTQSDTCQAGVCTGSNPISCTASDQCHGAGTCNPATGSCSNPAVADGTTCSDGSACTQSDSCQAGVCTGSNPVTCTASDQCHGAGTCNPTTGACSNPAVADGTTCSDGSACTQSDSCQAGVCTGSNPVTCTASDQCHGAGTCDPATGSCSNPAVADGTTCSDGSACTQSDSCHAGVCTGSNPITCTASDQCHGAGSCDPATGTCSNPVVADGTTCSDGSACTQSDSCQAGVCAGSNPVTCTASDQCHGAGTCNPTTGSCSNPAVADGTTCSDGSACTQSDACQAGVCTGSNPITCTASDQCHGAGTCDPATGTCSNPAVADGTTCSDGSACTQSDSCQAGVCTGSNPVTCTASDQCHGAGTCDPATGACSNPAMADGTTCSDGNGCTQSDTCHAGVCTGSNPVQCTAVDACHEAGTCNVATGTCSNPPSPSCPGGMPPDPATIAPPINRTVVTTLFSQTEFLYTGDSAIQTGVPAGTIEVRRAAEVHGRVLRSDLSPLGGVVVSVPGHPEFGQTATRADGRYDLVVNGGATLTIDFQKPTYLPAQRDASVPWNQFVKVPDVILLQPDANVTVLEVGSPSYQIARGSVVTDGDGTRQAVTLIPSGTLASAVMPDGSTAPLDNLSLRITEYTVGEHGPQRMPAALPPDSAYTYAFEIAADQATALGATGVQFNQPIVYYVDNFLSFPTGIDVPLGTYNRSCTSGSCTSGACGGWSAENNGRIIGIVSVTAGLANLDVDGDGQIDTGAKLSALSITPAEQQELAQLYAPGKSLWRLLLPHLSAWDANWGWGPPADAIGPNSGGAVGDLSAQCCTDVGAARVDSLSQTAIESQPIVGTPYSLVYQSDRVAGRSGRSVTIPLTGATLPASVERVELEITVAGRTFEHSFPPSPNLSYDFEWDGLDAFGRPLQGGQPISVHIAYAYKGTYERVERFGYKGNGLAITGSQTRGEVTFPRDEVVRPASFDMGPVGLGGWNVDVHHPFDPDTAVAFGECSNKPAFEAPVLTEFAGGNVKVADTGVPALDAFWFTTEAIAAGPDGSVYVVDRYNPAIYKIGPDRILTRVAGTKVGGYNGDDIPATQAMINPAAGRIAVSRDCDGGFYFVDAWNYRVRHVDKNGIIHTVAGNGASTFTANGVPATQTSFLDPRSVAVAPDGSVYVGDNNGLVVRVGVDGILAHVAGTYRGPRGSTADGIPALQAWVDVPAALTVGGDGTLFIADATVLNTNAPRIRQVRADGLISTLAGGGTLPPKEGLDARAARFSLSGMLATGKDGTHYVVHARQIWAVRPDGKLHLVAGNGAVFNGQPSSSWNGVPATATGYELNDIAIGPDGALYTSEFRNIRRVAAAMPGAGLAEYVVPSRDGREVYVYDGAGRHLRTLDALTNATRFTLGYDAKGRLASITDKAGNATTITHDASGNPTGIVAPRGQLTTLTTGEDGFLASSTNPASEAFVMTYAPGSPGLLASYTDPAGNVSHFAYDGRGRLTHYDDASGGVLTLVSTLSSGELSVSQSTALGVASSYSYEAPAPGSETRTTTLASGKEASQSIDGSGAKATKLVNGATTTIAEVPDPRFRMLAPLAGTITALTPAGLSYTQTLTRSVTLSNPANVFSLVSLTDTTTVDPNSNLRFQTTYTASNRTSTMTTPAGRTRRQTLDTLGRLSSTQSDSLTPTAFGYDTLGRLASITQAARSRSYTYDASGLLASVKDPLQQTTTFQRDAAGRVRTETLADGQIAAFGYDPKGELASMTPPSRPAHGFAHSATGKLTTYVAPSVAGLIAPTTRWNYDVDGRLASFVRADGGAALLGYDTSGRLATATASGATIAFHYDAATGRLGSATSPSGDELAFTYDGSLTRGIAWSGRVTGEVQWGYDKFQKLAWETVNGIHGVGYAYDADGLVTKAGLMTLTPSPTTGLLTATALGNVTDAITYDTFGAPATYVAKALGTTVFSVTTTRDALGRVATQSETVQGQTHPYAYTYDARGRLTNVTKDGASVGHWTYDANGNRTQATTASGTSDATLDAQDRLVTSGALAYTYGPDGEVLTKTDTTTNKVTSYAYDAFGNLTQVTLPNGKTIEYVIDAAGRRVAKKVDGTTLVQWLYRDSRRPVAELDGIGNVLRRFVYADNDVADKSVATSLRERFGLSRGSSVTAADLARPMYIVDGAQTLRVITDHLGSPRLVIDTTTGAVVQALTYDAWGAITSVTGTDLPTFGFAGGLHDPDTGLVHFGAREYDPQAARWMSKEPMKNSGTLNFYEYAGGDPINAVDPEGLAKTTAPDKQAVLDSICGPDAEGEVSCNVQEVEDALEKAIAEQGAATGAPTDATAEPHPTTDLPVHEIDGSGTTSSGPVNLGGGSAPVNQPPTVSVGASATMTVTLPASNIALSGTVADDGLPTGYGLQRLWFTQRGPADAVFTDDSNPVTTVNFPVGGVYELVLIASDGEYSRSAKLTVSVAQPPIVAAAGPSFISLVDTAVLTGTASTPVLLPGRTLATAWTKASGPGTVTFTAPAALTTDATFSAPGDYVVQLEATDGYLTSAAQVAITVVQINQAPIVSAGADQTLPPATMTTTLAGSATDDGLPEGAALTYAWSLVGGPASAAIAAPTSPVTGVTFTYPGAYLFELAVSDGQKTATAMTTVNVGAPSGSKPTVSIAGLGDDGVITEPTDVRATISEGSWVLESRRGGRDDVEKAWTVLASGSGAVYGTRLATFDPTVLLNGLYTVRLSATTTAGETSSSVSVAVDGRMKVGLFTLTFTDLESVVGNMPFEIQRTYDSRDKDLGDFGVGWNLSLRNVRIEKSGKIGAYWTQTVDDSGFFMRWCLEPAQSATITITFPGGRQYRFRAKSSPHCQWMTSLTSTDLVFENVSDPDNKTIKLTASQQSAFVSGSLGAVELLDGNGETLDSRAFTLTTEDGTKYHLDQDKGVTGITDVNGNSLTITDQGIMHSSGKNVQFVRDARRRITKIVDPQGNAMTYAYDDKGDLVSFTDRAANRTTFGYVSNHYLEDIVDPLNRRAMRSEYDESGRLIKQTDAAGNAVTYTHDLSAHSEQVRDRLGHVTLYEYNAKGDITRKTDAAGGVWKYAFDSRGNQLSETDPLGHTIQRTFDSANDVLTETDALGNVTRHTYNRFRREETTTDPRGYVTTYNNDPYNRLSTVDALGNKTTTYAYDWMGNKVGETDALGNTTTYAHDSKGRVTRKTDALGRVTDYTYDANGHKLTETTTRTNNGSPQTQLTSYQYDAAGRLLKTTYPDATFTTTEYSPTGKVTARVDELGRRTTSAYDALDRLITTTRPDGTTETVTYDAENRRASTTDAAGHTTTYQYDNVGRLTVTAHPDGKTTQTMYDLAGRVIGTMNELGHLTTTAYDDAGRRTSVTDATGGVTEFTYDAAGNQVASVDPLGRLTAFTFDGVGRQVSTMFADGSTESSAYDAAGRTIAKFDPLGRMTSFGYDGLGRLVAVTDALGKVTSYSYDEVGNRVTQKDANGRTTSFGFDARGRPTQRTLPDGSFETKTYDAAGEVSSRRDFMGRTTTYGYDAVGRLVTRTYPDTTTASFTYTPIGQRATATDARGVTRYTYDARNRLTALVYPDSRELDYGYDATGARTTLTAKIGTWSGTTTTTYDASGRATAIQDPAGRWTSLTYDAAGQRTSLTHPNGVATAYGYDERGRVKTIGAVGSGSLQVTSFAYTLDAAGRRTRVDEALGTTRTYDYDSVDRLTSETVTSAQSYVKTFTYDAVGNRLTQATTGAGAGTVNYAYDTRDRLQTESGIAYGYNANGDVTSKSGEATYAWDYEDRLTTASMVGDGSVSHVYDVDGNRVKTTVSPSGGSPTVTNMLVDPSGSLSHVVAETDGSSALTALYVRAGNELLAVLRPAGATWSTRWVHSDALGSVRALTDEAGIAAEQRGYEAFGTMNVQSGTDPLPYRFAGEPFESTTKLAYHRARWMDSRVGRFHGIDPFEGSIWRPQTLHPYFYATNNPVSFVDPTGRSTLAAVCVSVAVVGVMATTAIGHGSTANVRCEVNATAPLPGLDSHASDAVPYDAFLASVGDKTLAQVQHEAVRSGSPPAGDYSAEGPNASVRFVRDPANPTNVIDMRHFLVIGFYGQTFGLAVEIWQEQGAASRPSAFDPQDFFSNKLGEQFFDSYHVHAGDALAQPLKRYFDSRFSLGRECGTTQ